MCQTFRIFAIDYSDTYDKDLYPFKIHTVPTANFFSTHVRISVVWDFGIVYDCIKSSMSQVSRRRHIIAFKKKQEYFKMDKVTI
jgi:hypothetical protein